MARYLLRIATFASPTCIRRLRYGGPGRNIAIRFDSGKTRMVWLKDGEKSLRIYLLSTTEYMNVTEKRTDGQIDRHSAMA